MKFIRQVFNSAFKEDLIEYHQNPFLKYHIKPEKTERSYLTEQELEQIQNLSLPERSRLELHRDMFVFAAYAGGLRVSDVLQLKWKNFDGTHVHLSIKKTSQQISIKLPVIAIQILEKQGRREVSPEHFIFPMLSNSLDTSDAFQLDRELSSATAYINKNLRIICSRANIQKPVSFHVSRHTWATRALRKGISIDKVSKIMGHATIAQTQIYARIVNEELDKAMEAFNL
jgi:integrase